MWRPAISVPWFIGCIRSPQKRRNGASLRRRCKAFCWLWRATQEPRALHLQTPLPPSTASGEIGEVSGLAAGDASARCHSLHLFVCIVKGKIWDPVVARLQVTKVQWPFEYLLIRKVLKGGRFLSTN